MGSPKLPTHDVSAAGQRRSKPLLPIAPAQFFDAAPTRLFAKIDAFALAVPASTFTPAPSVDAWLSARVTKKRPSLLLVAIPPPDAATLPVMVLFRIVRVPVL